MKGGKPFYDRQEKIVRAARFQRGVGETTPERIRPDRRLFGPSWNLDGFRWRCGRLMEVKLG